MPFITPITKSKEPEMAKSDEANAFPSMDFPPIPNGIDYLVSVVKLLGHTNNEPTHPRNLKYAVLHLQAATEVLLKARLKKEHWTLVVKDASKTKKGKYFKGDFESPNTVETIRRLKEVVGIVVDRTDEQAIINLAKTRNALQHWGLTEAAPAVEARAATVLDFLIRFLDRHLLTSCPTANTTKSKMICKPCDKAYSTLTHTFRVAWTA